MIKKIIITAIAVGIIAYLFGVQGADLEKSRKKARENWEKYETEKAAGAALRSRIYEMIEDDREKGEENEARINKRLPGEIRLPSF